jgi:hypothetical protein
MHWKFWYYLNRAAWKSSNRLMNAGFRIPYTQKRTRAVVLRLSDRLWALGHVALRRGAGLDA